MNKKIVVANSKGGAGKSVTSIMLAEVSAGAGKRTLLVDAGYQRHSTEKFLQDEPGIAENNLLTALMAKSLKKAVYPVRENLSVVPATVKLADFSEYFSGVKAKDMIFKTYLTKELSAYDVVVFDTESSLSTITRNSLLMADTLLVPVWDRGSVDEAVKLIRVMEDIRDAYGKHFSCARIAVLPVMQKILGKGREVIRYAREQIDPGLFLRPVKFHNAIFLGEDYATGKPLEDYKKSLEELIHE